MPKPGFIISARTGQRKQVVELAQELDRRGFPHVFCPHDYSPILTSKGTKPPPYDALSLTTAVIQATKQIRVGSGIAVTYTRHPVEMAAAAAFNHELSDGRFVLGLGIGHADVLTRYGIPSERPIPHMRRYVAEVKEAAADWAMPPIILAVLRRKMTYLTGEIADGFLANNWALPHFPTTLKEFPGTQPEGFIRGAIVPAYVSEDRSEGLAAVRHVLSFYLRMNNYVEYYREVGYGEDAERGLAALAAGDDEAMLNSISEEMAEGMGIIGTASQVRDKVEQWQAAGIEWLTLSALQASGSQYDSIMRIAKIFD